VDLLGDLLSSKKSKKSETDLERGIKNELK